MTKIQELAQLGQAIWLDYIQRGFIKDGSLQKLIDLGLRGMTSNPTIFEKAIAHSQDYDRDLAVLARQGKDAAEAYLELAITDIQQAADLLRPVYDQTTGADGYVSLEVSPYLANDSNATAREAHELWKRVDRPNLMIKIPGTQAGLPAITQSIARGINVNVTLIFSLERYAEVMAAYIKGLELRQAQGQPLNQIASVASFFVSRVDTKVDRLLDEIIRKEGPNAQLAHSLLGKAAVANARMAYAQFKSVFEGSDFRHLAEKGARLQRPLWASTSTKNPAYSDIFYVQELIGAHTVNTLPQETLEHFLDHGKVKLTLETGLDQARSDLHSLEHMGISMAQVTQELEDEGVASFSKSFDALLDSIEIKRKAFVPTKALTGPLSLQLPEFAAAEAALHEMQDQRILERIWQHDHTVWKPAPDEISNRLGWLDIAERMRGQIDDLQIFTDQLFKDGYTQALLLGMGGSSLAPDLFTHVLANPARGLQLEVLDSTHPEAVRAHQERLDPGRTLFIVSTKSGGTEETLSFFRYFYNWAAQALGVEHTGEHFIAITDPGSKLVELAERYHFRQVWLNNPNIGGRYSALSYFGLLPAALCGVDLGRLLGDALAMAKLCGPQTPPQENPAARLGAYIGEMAKAGRDKLTFFLSQEIAGFGGWVEQLIAESTGKEGKGILPVVEEPIAPPEMYANDRLFIHMHLLGDESHSDALKNIVDAGQPVIDVQIRDRYNLGGQFFLWELATAIAGYRLGIQPFDQPNVESAKLRARQMVATYKAKGKLPTESPLLERDGLQVYGNANIIKAATAEEALAQFLAQARPGDYITLQAFVAPNLDTENALQALRTRLRERYRLATTSGFGPRFLHSTGQMHKGDGGNGLFIQFTDEPAATGGQIAPDQPGHDLPIPDQAGSPESSIQFSVLVQAQALGDRQALLDAVRRVISIHIQGDVAETLRKLTWAL
jgi:transaldolase/glucose-6-phosphate isomerase